MAYEPSYDQKIGFSAAAAATTALVAATSGARTSVQGLRMTAGGTVVVTIKSGTNVLEIFNLVAGVPLVLPLRTKPYMRTNKGEALNITLGAAIQVDAQFEVITAPAD